MKEVKRIFVGVLCDIGFAILAAVFAHYLLIGLVPNMFTRVSGLVANTGKSIELNMNEFMTGYGTFDAQGYANALAAEKQAEVERRQKGLEQMKEGMKETFSILNCFLILFGLRFIYGFIIGNYRPGREEKNSRLEIEVVNGNS